jgi:hypothetical protein
MRIKEITENYVSNYHMGIGSERPQDQRILERPKTKRRERKLKDNAAFGVGTADTGGQWANSGAKFKQM